MENSALTSRSCSSERKNDFCNLFFWVQNILPRGLICLLTKMAIKTFWSFFWPTLSVFGRFSKFSTGPILIFWNPFLFIFFWTKIKKLPWNIFFSWCIFLHHMGHNINNSNGRHLCDHWTAAEHESRCNFAKFALPLKNLIRCNKNSNIGSANSNIWHTCNRKGRIVQFTQHSGSAN